MISPDYNITLASLWVLMDLTHPKKQVSTVQGLKWVTPPDLKIDQQPATISLESSLTHWRRKDS